MFETLMFNETRQKPTRDKKSYEPYPVKEVAIVSQKSLRITCQNEDAANHSAKCVASILTGRHFSRNEEFDFKRGKIEHHGNQFILEGDLRGLIGVLAQVSCISDELRDTIYKDAKFSHLSPERSPVQYDEDELVGLSPEPIRKSTSSTQKPEMRDLLADLVKTHKPELWDTLSSSPEKDELLTTLVEGFKEAVSKTTPRNNRSPSITAK